LLIVLPPCFFTRGACRRVCRPFRWAGGVRPKWDFRRLLCKPPYGAVTGVKG